MILAESGREMMSSSAAFFSSQSTVQFFAAELHMPIDESDTHMLARGAEVREIMIARGGSCGRAVHYCQRAALALLAALRRP